MTRFTSFCQSTIVATHAGTMLDTTSGTSYPITDVLADDILRRRLQAQDANGRTKNEIHLKPVVAQDIGRVKAARRQLQTWWWSKGQGSVAVWSSSEPGPAPDSCTHIDGLTVEARGCRFLRDESSCASAFTVRNGDVNLCGWKTSPYSAPRCGVRSRTGLPACAPTARPPQYESCGCLNLFWNPATLSNTARLNNLCLAYYQPHWSGHRNAIPGTCYAKDAAGPCLGPHYECPPPKTALLSAPKAAQEPAVRLGRQNIGLHSMMKGADG